MKYNLKNRPDRRRWKDVIYDKEMEDWFVGFEEELREIYDEPLMPFLDVETLLKEILGE